jgi:ribosomal protein L21E
MRSKEECSVFAKLVEGDATSESSRIPSITSVTTRNRQHIIISSLSSLCAEQGQTHITLMMTTNRSISPLRETQPTLKTNDIVQVVSKHSLYCGKTGVVMGFSSSRLSAIISFEGQTDDTLTTLRCTSLQKTLKPRRVSFSPDSRNRTQPTADPVSSERHSGQSNEQRIHSPTSKLQVAESVPSSGALRRDYVEKNEKMKMTIIKDIDCPGNSLHLGDRVRVVANGSRHNGKIGFIRSFTDTSLSARVEFVAIVGKMITSCQTLNIEISGNAREGYQTVRCKSLQKIELAHNLTKR